MKRLVIVVIVVLVVIALVVKFTRCETAIITTNICPSDDDLGKVAHQVKYMRSASGDVTASVDGTCRAPCSGNSPIVNSFPVNGIDPTGAGACNPEHIRVDSGTAGKAKACPNGSLQFVKTTGTLAIKNLSGQTCAGTDLKDTSFTVRSNYGHATFTIKDVKQIPYSDANTPPIMREGYRITATLSDPNDTVSLCDATRAAVVRKTIGLSPNIGDYSATVGSGSGSGSGSADPSMDYVIALPGPLYSNNVKPIADSSGFFNLACATDALAKVTLGKYTVPTDGDSTQYTALRMMTATYCNHPRTTQGMRFVYVRGIGGSGSAEAQWSASGAFCLEAPRLEERGPYADITFGKDLIPAGCGSDGHQGCSSFTDFATQVRLECAGSANGDDPVTIKDHCGSDEKGVIYESYVTD